MMETLIVGKKTQQQDLRTLKKYPKGKEWNNHNFKNYSKNGCGYGEGGALSIVLKNNNIKVLQLIEKTLF